MSTTNTRATGIETFENYAIETTENTVPTTGTLYKIRKSTESMNGDSPREMSGDITDDGMRASTVAATKTVGGDISGQLSHQSHLDFYRQICGRASYTTDTLSDDVDIDVSGTVYTAQFNSGGASAATVSISGVIVNGPIKFSAFATGANNGIWNVVSVDSASGKLVFSKTYKDQTTPITESVASATIVQGPYVKHGGTFKESNAIEKGFMSVNKADSINRFLGQYVSSMGHTFTTGGGVDISVTFVGMSEDSVDNAMMGPGAVTPWTGYTGTGNIATATQVTLISGSDTIAINDQFYAEDDTSNSKYTVVSIGGSNGIFSVTPALQTTLPVSAVVFFSRPGTARGEAQKMENNLGYAIIDGSVACTTGATLNIVNNAVAGYCVGDANASYVTFGNKDVDGSLETLKSSAMQALIAKARAGTLFPGVWYFRDRDGNTTAITLPSIDGSHNVAAVGGDGEVPKSIPISALKSSTYGTNCIVSVITA